MSTLREAAQQALKVMQEVDWSDEFPAQRKAITDLQAALAEPEGMDTLVSSADYAKHLEAIE